MLIAGDSPVDLLHHDSPRLTLICHTDLVDPLPCSAFRLAELYESKGDDFVRDFHGWFAIVLYDHEQRRLKAWTDHWGIRRVVYTIRDGMLLVGSDLRLLLPACDDPPEIDPVAILEYAQFAYVPAPRTIYAGFRRLEPGCRLTGAESRKYWDMDYPVDDRNPRPISAWARDTEKAIRDAVTLHTSTA